MLARLQTEEPQAAGPRLRGRLKIFFGYAAGVGKTYTMLEMARAQKAEGVDVVVGLVETHRRAETEALLEGLAVLRRKIVEYRNVALREFDLDAAKKRKPALCVVDELAHTNNPGVRHAKRWQDVKELLEAGIDVYTTINVQHIESLNDVVAQISGIRVAETVPDHVFDEADDVELVDLPPDELLDRFSQGKVYVPEQAEQAMRNFFKKPNLIALREIALRKTADRVNVDVQTARLGQTSSRTWPTRERLLVCVGPSPTSAKVIRSARRLAYALNAEWIAVAVGQPASRKVTDEDRRRLAKNLQLAESLGAQTTILSGEDVAEEIVEYATSKNVTKIAIGKSERRHRFWGMSATIVDKLLASSGDIDVYVVRGFGDLMRLGPSEHPRTAWQFLGYLHSLWIMLVVTVTALVARAAGLTEANIVMTILLGVAVTAFRLGIGPAVFASIVGVLLFNFFFTQPYYTLVVTDLGYIYTFAVMLVIALSISTMAHRVRRHVQALRDTQKRTESLYQLTHQLVGAAGMGDIVVAAQRQISEVFGAEVVVLLPDQSNRVRVRFGAAPAFVYKPHEISAAQWVYEHNQPAGRGTDTLPTAEALYVPLMSQDGPVGVLAVKLGEPQKRLQADQRQLLETFAAQVAMAVQRERMRLAGPQLRM
jgi:two-component system, OmpR family, sensor histidine kinase KdpD